jgi:ABC-type lipoprotein release transport system permease subunit
MGAWFPYFRIDIKTYLAAIGFSALLSLVASLIPAVRAGKMSVASALRRVA